MREAGSNRSGGWRIPAGDLEGLVITKLCKFLTDPTAILEAVDEEAPGGTGQSQLIERGRQIADDLGVQLPDKIKATLMALACRVDVNSDRIELSLSRRRLTKMLAGQSIDLTT